MRVTYVSPPLIPTISLSRRASETAKRSEVIALAVETLRAGGLLLFPTETTYGAGVDATNQEAVNKLLAYKSRREGKPLSIAVCDKAMAEQYVEINESATKVYERFLPGPVTVVSRSKGLVAKGVESEFGTLGVRYPDYDLVLDIVRALGKPMTATSANGSGEKRPYSVADIMGGLSEKQKNLIDLVLDVGELPHRPPSTVIDTTLSTPVTFRQGDVVVTATEQNDAAMERYITESVRETQDLAGKLMLKHWDAIKQTGLIVGLDGSLGMGKTIFTKGIATFLHITDTITSPTYTYQEEYPFERHGVRGMLYHLDAWKVDAAAQWQRLGVTKHVGAGHVIVIEWWDQVAAFAGFPTNIPLVHVQLKGRRWNMDQERTIRVWTTPAAAATAATPAPDVPSGLSELGAPGAPEK